MSNAMERPLVTFALIAYNHEQFIKEAVEGALAQTYSPLQIILSDDCSTDHTFTIIQTIVEEYKGPHQITLNRNKCNLGLGNHINHVMDISQGKLIVLAAGDDISLPERTEFLVNNWLALDMPPALCSNFYNINKDGQRHGDPDSWYINFMPRPHESIEDILTRFIIRGTPALVGCTEAWRKELFSQFPPLNDDVWLEDSAISFRAWLLGRIHYLPQKLVEYRQHETNISNKLSSKPTSIDALIKIEKNTATWLAHKTAALKMHQQDLDCAENAGNVDKHLYASLRPKIARQILKNEYMTGWWNISYLSRLARAINLIILEPNIIMLRWVVPRLLPIQVYLRLKLART